MPEKDPKNYRWGIFYYNPQDNRVLAPKSRPSWGFQVNFANPIN